MGILDRIRGFELAVKTREMQDGNKELVTYWDGKLPERATKHSAGYDFFAAEDMQIPSIWGPVFSRLFIKHTDGQNPNESHHCYVRKNYRGETDEEKQKSIDVVHTRFKPILVHTGVKAYMLKDEALFLYNRSGNPGKLGLVLANGVGVVDSDYYGNKSNDGEIMFAFYNFMPWTISIKKGDKLGQGVFQKYLRADGDTATGKRNGGFGSTDMKKATGKFMKKAVDAVDKAVDTVKEKVDEHVEKADETVEAQAPTVTITEDTNE